MTSDVESVVLQETLTVEEEERPELIWWKAKKWAMHLMARVFERYGTPSAVQVNWGKGTSVAREQAVD